jgi:hypothetical protein
MALAEVLVSTIVLAHLSVTAAPAVVSAAIQLLIVRLAASLCLAPVIPVQISSPLTVAVAPTEKPARDLVLAIVAPPQDLVEQNLNIAKQDVNQLLVLVQPVPM